MKKVIRILGFLLFIPTIFICLLFVQVYWINSLIILPFKIYSYGFKKGFKSLISDNLSFTKEILNRF